DPFPKGNEFICPQKAKLFGQDDLEKCSATVWPWEIKKGGGHAECSFHQARPRNAHPLNDRWRRLARHI
ncbi:MAG: hypothetical protein AAB354_05200, partial [candidate division KSB1 bacterium]